MDRRCGHACAARVLARATLALRAAMVLTHCPAADCIVAGSPCTVPRAEWEYSKR